MSTTDIASERAFLHSIASPLATVQLLVEGSLEDLKAEGLSPEAVSEVLSRVLKAASEMTQLIQKRRALIIQQTEQQSAGGTGKSSG